MKKFLRVLFPLVFFLSTAQATYLPGTAPTMVVGPYTFSQCEVSHNFRLYAHVGTSGRVSSFRAEYAAADYVTASATRIIAIQAFSDVSTTTCQFAYATAAQGNNAAAITGTPTYLDGVGASLRTSISNAAGKDGVAYLGTLVPAGKYPFVSGLANATTCIAYAVLTSDCP